MRFAKWLPTPLKQSTLDRRTYVQPISYKPHGLWFDVESDWRRWAEDNVFHLDQLDYRHTLRIDLTDVFVMPRASDLDWFTEMFGTRMVSRDTTGEAVDMGPGYFEEAAHCFIDWPRVARMWKGVLIPNYIWSRRMELMWYYGWDCASGVVWDTSIVEIVRVRKNKHKYPPQPPPTTIGDLKILGARIVEQPDRMRNGTWSEEMPF